MIDFFPFIERKFVLKLVAVWLCSHDNNSRVHRTRASFRGWREHTLEEREPHFSVWNVLKVDFFFFKELQFIIGFEWKEEDSLKLIQFKKNKNPSDSG